jgi:hypothetical protein
MVNKRTTLEVPIEKTLGFKEHTIKVRYENKTASDSLIVNGVSMRSNYLTLLNLRINNLLCKPFLTTLGTFVPDDGSEYTMGDPLAFTKQGTYTFTLKSPYAYFFLPKI